MDGVVVQRIEWPYKGGEKRFTGFVGTQLPFALLARVNHYSTTYIMLVAGSVRK